MMTVAFIDAHCSRTNKNVVTNYFIVMSFVFLSNRTISHYHFLFSDLEIILSLEFFFHRSLRGIREKQKVEEKV